MVHCKNHSLGRYPPASIDYWDRIAIVQHSVCSPLVRPVRSRSILVIIAMVNRIPGFRLYGAGFPLKPGL